MKIVCYGESPADQAAVAVFAEGILDKPLEPTGMDLEGHGVTSVLNALGGVFRGVYYNSDAEGLIVVVDSDDTEMHHLDHDKPGDQTANCRLCQARAIVNKAREHLKAKPGSGGLRVAIGLAVPCIEAWYLVGKEHQVGEAAWRAGLNAGKVPFTRARLKELVYGNIRPSLEYQTECATKEARRIIENINAIETAFPAGFGLMASKIRSWKKQ